MRPTTSLTMALALAALAGTAPCRAQIFRCPSGEGVTFQQGPCDGLGASGGRLIRTSDGQTVRAPDAVAAAPAPAASAAPAARVYGHTPQPDTRLLRSAKSP